MSRLLPGKTATIFISTGELSGEMHGAHLAESIQALRKERGLAPAIIEGNGSQRMAAAGVDLLFDVSTWGEMGIIANLLKAQTLLHVLRSTIKYILSNQPDMVVLIDSRVLSTNLARILRQRGYTGRIVYYVSPVIWQSLYDPVEQQRSLKSKRFLAVKRYCDLAIPIYPVSLQTYEELEIPYEFVGHPLCELAKPQLSDEVFASVTGIPYDCDNPPLIVGVLPGSRQGEVRHIAPPIFKALALMREAFSEDPDLPDLYPVAVLAHRDLLPAMMKAVRGAGLTDLALIEPQHVYDLMARARLMIAKSGTGIHECMLMDVPAIMCYRFHPFVAWVGRRIQRFSMPYYCLPNLLAGRHVVPELIQEECNHRRIIELAGSLFYEERERQAMLKAYGEIREMLCRPQPLRRAAELVSELLKQ